MRLTGNTVVITGGTSGIGRQLAERLLARGNRVIVCGRRRERLDQLQGQHREVSTFQCDLSQEDERTAFAQWVTANHPGTNVLVNNAGIQYVTDLTKPLQLDRARLEIETNLVAPLHLCSLFAPLLAHRDGAAIVNVSSGLAFVPLAFVPVYCATKAAVHSLCLSLRSQVRPLGIAVYEIAPPAVDSELGPERWPKGQGSHGGMPVTEFVEAMLAALEAGTQEAAIGQAQAMQDRREAMFDDLNRPRGA
jgi:uncharacterized oxidoreductase